MVGKFWEWEFIFPKEGGISRVPGDCSHRNVWIQMQDYKSMHVAVVICVILVNTQTDRQLLICYTVSRPTWLKIDERNAETVLSHCVTAVTAF